MMLSVQRVRSVLKVLSPMNDSHNNAVAILYDGSLPHQVAICLPGSLVGWDTVLYWWLARAVLVLLLEDGSLPFRCYCQIL